MAGMAKKKAVVATSSESPGTVRQQNIPRQRGIPTRVSRNDDRKLDLNRNPRPASLTNFANHESSSTENDLLHNSDNDNDKDRKTSLLKSGLCLFGPVNSVKALLKTNSRSQASYLLASSNDNDIEKSAEKGKLSTGVNVSKSQPINKHNTESSHVENHYASHRIPSKISYSKQLHGNRNHSGKNLNKISSSDETCVVKSEDSCSRVKMAVSVKEISLSADHLTVQEVLGKNVSEELLSSDLVKKSDREETPGDISNNVKTRSNVTDRRRLLRSRTEIPNSEPRTNLRPRSSGPLIASHDKMRGSASGERSPLNKDSRKQNASRKSSEIFPVESSEREQGGYKRRKSSGNIGHKTLEPNEQSVKSPHISNTPKLHVLTRTQNTPTGTVGKADRIKKSHDVEIHSSSSFKKSDMHTQEPCEKRHLVPKIQVPEEQPALESKQVVVLPDVSGLREKSAPCKASSDSPKDDGRMHQALQSLLSNNSSEATSDLDGRVFHTRRRADLGEQLNRGSWNNEMDESVCVEFHNPLGEEKQSMDLGNVIIDSETFHQMVEDLKALKLTVLELQNALLQVDTVESKVCGNDMVDRNVPVNSQCSSIGNEIISSSVCSSDVRKENLQLQKQVNELEKLIWEQKKIIDSLKQPSNGGVVFKKQLLHN